MPELPDVVVYMECLERRVVGQKLERVRIVSPFVLRTADPPISLAEGKTVREVRRLGKRIVFALEDELFLVVHLMISGRFAWAERGARIPGKIGLAALDFPTGTLVFREASTKKRASMHLVRGEDALRTFDRGGLEVLTAKLAEFRAVLARENHTLKVALVDPTLFSGIGNAYSDEILHRARLSPVKLTSRLTPEEAKALFQATKDVLEEWTDRLGVRWLSATQISFGDVDRDGAVDILVGTNASRLTAEQRRAKSPFVGLLRNLAAAREGNRALSLRLRGRGKGGASTDAIGARATLEVGGRRLLREVRAGSGHGGHRDDLELIFGCGKAETLGALEVRWPDAKGTVQRFAGLGPGRYVLEEGGEPREAP